MQWIVYRHNVNADKIEPWNVFDHGGFAKDIETAFSRYKHKEDFAKEIKSSLMYYYWSKAEWEVVVAPWCGGRNAKEIKIDVYDQVMNNWEQFIDYTWGALQSK